MLAYMSSCAAYVVRHGQLCRPASRARAPFLAEGQTTEGKTTNPFLQPGVPKSQQPIMEVIALRRSPFFDWAELSEEGYWAKLRVVYILLMVLLALPISYQSYPILPGDLPQLLLTAHIGGGFALLAFVGRLRSGWSFVGSRLRSKEFYYEEKQRGFLSTKDRDTLARDQLVEQGEVAPVVARLDGSLLKVAASVVVAVVALNGITYLESRLALQELQGGEARRFESRLNDDLARRAQERALSKEQRGGEAKPQYCDSRYYKVLAGGNGQGGVGCN